jgi:hypothetical protein
MPFDQKTERAAQLAHLTEMARLPGWKSYAWERAKALDADRSGLFAGLAADLTSAMRPNAGQASASESVALTATKPR